MPIWAAILVAVLAAFASGGFGAWLRAWNDRHERFRDRLIEAADEFVVAASNALIVLRDAIGEVRAGDPAGAKKESEDAWAMRDVVLKRSARVDLLFGPGSETARASTDLVTALATANHVLRPPSLDPNKADSSLMDATGCLQRFERAAFAGIRRAAPPSATVRESIRRALLRNA
jgi:hypothetical protein